MTGTDKSLKVKLEKGAYIFLFLIFGLSGILEAQRPPRPITVVKLVDLAFGTFYQSGTLGDVIVTTSNTRSATGSVYLFGGNLATSAVFRVTGNPGTLITLMLGGTVQLMRTGGGYMDLVIGPTNPLSPFVLSGGNPATKDVSVGGTLTVKDLVSNPPGAYDGQITITFNQN